MPGKNAGDSSAGNLSTIAEPIEGVSRASPAREPEMEGARVFVEAREGGGPERAEDGGRDGQRRDVGPAACRIVGIGASAGGLEPFEDFFDHMPADTGLAFVIIQHLSPDFRSMMDELLDRHSTMSIKRVHEGMPVEPNVIYLNPPRTEMALCDGRFSLLEVPSNQALHLPIDTFLSSLAEEKREDAVAIILSGTGSDGTRGAKLIRKFGGTVLVQEPDSAKFDGMPRSVIDADQADATAPPHQLAELVCRLARGEDIGRPEEEGSGEPKQLAYQILRDRFSTDFSHYKDATIERRLQRRAELVGSGSVAEYVERLKKDSEEVEALYSDFLIEVTAFFRDAPAYSALENQVIPKLVQIMTPDRPVRVWVPGCASGEEAYSVAIAMSECARKTGVDLNLKIFATDIHHRSLEAANTGLYDEDTVNAIPIDVRERYFDKNGHRYQIRPAIRQMVVFSVHNILRDPPFTKIDLVSCRNLLIYLNEPAQQKALAFFHFALVKDGFLFLGPSETVGKLSDEFALLDQRWRIFSKRRDVRLIESMSQVQRRDGPSRSSGSAISSIGSEAAMLRGEARRASDRTFDLLLKRYAPPGFLLSRNGELVRIFGDAGQFVRIGEGDFSRRLDDLVREDLRSLIAAALDRAKSPQVLPFERRVRTRDVNGDISVVTVALEGISDGRRDGDFLLLTISEEVREVPSAGIDDPAIAAQEADDFEAVALLRQTTKELERELQSTEETLQTTIEELETSNEELQATNEELMASNEELQSTNEELHSVNEELYTVSAEHQRKIVELTEMSGDMEHLLKATEIGTVFIDSDLNVRRFTPAATRVFNILDQDVGRPIAHITNHFGDWDLTGTLRKVIETGEPADREAQIGDEHMLLRILPYTRGPGDIAGCVVTSIDVTELKRTETASHRLASRYEAIVDDASHFIFRWNAEDKAVSFCNSALLDYSGLKREAAIGRPVDTLIPEAKQESFFAAIEPLKPGDAKTFFLDGPAAGGRWRWSEGVIRAIGDGSGKVIEYQAVGRDVTLETTYRVALERLSRMGEEDGNNHELVISKLLQIGCEFFHATLGVFSEIVDDRYRIEAIVGGERFGLEKDQELPLEQTFCSVAIRSEEPLALHHVSQSDLRDHAAHTGSGIERYIGQKIHVGQASIGALSFSSRERRTTPFQEVELNFMRILAEWVGRRVERHQALADIEQARDDLQLIIDNVRAKIWFKDDKNRILRLNKVAADSMGLTVAEGTGGDTYELFPDMAAKYHEDDLKVIDAGEPMLDIVEEYTPRDGPRRWVKTDKIPYSDPATGERRVLVIAMDITTLKEQEERFSELNAELSEKNQRLLHTNQGLERFAHVASHDLQEPLRKLMQFTEYLEQDCEGQLSEDGRYFLDVISRSSQRMRQLVSDLLALSSASGQELTLESVDFGVMVQDILAEIQVTVDASEAEIDIGTLPIVTCDATLVHQLLQNLISNALKYRSEGSKPKVTIASRQIDEGGLQITVADSGIGIDMEHLDRIFDPFTRLHDRKIYDGTGIGLAICRTVCDRHGWSIRAENNEDGTGSSFIVEILVRDR